MTPIMRLVHFLAFTAWIGGAFAVLLSETTIRRLDRSLWGGVADVQAAIYRVLIGPGSLLTVFSGFVLTMEHYGAMSLAVGPWLGMMQGTGILGALFTLLGAMPAASRLSRLEPVGPSGPAFDAARRKLLLFGMIGAVLSFLALIAGALYRGG